MEPPFSGPFDIMIQAGQSNCTGWGQGAVTTPYIPSDRVLYMEGGILEDTDEYTVSVAAERALEHGVVSDMGLFFARRYMEEGCLEKGRALLILRASLGGTGFIYGYLDRRWDKKGALFLNLIKMIRRAKSLHPENRFIALMWHQGETDANHNASYAGHYANFAGLIDAVRAETRPDLPFAAGDFVPQWKLRHMSICEPVVSAIQAVCLEKGGAFINTDGLLSNDQVIGDGDQIHFARPALCRLGNAYFEAFWPTFPPAHTE